MDFIEWLRQEGIRLAVLVAIFFLCTTALFVAVAMSAGPTAALITCVGYVFLVIGVMALIARVWERP